jgi:hypothetical protein
MWVINATPRPLYPREKDPIPIIRRAEEVPEMVWTGAANLAARPPPGFDLGTVQPVASSHTDCAIPTALTI